MRRSTARRFPCRRLWPLSALIITCVAAAFGGVGQSGAAGAATPKRGVVTITMAMVGNLGNPSVGVIQTFGGPKGQFVDPPANKGNTGIYKSYLQELQ
jgi:hypothetical protein